MTLAERLRQYNRWRRGEDWAEDQPGPDPKELGFLIDKAADAVDQRDELMAALVHIECEPINAEYIARAAIDSAKGDIKQEAIDQCAECRKLCRPAPSLCARCKADAPAFTEAVKNFMKGGAA